MKTLNSLRRTMSEVKKFCPDVSVRQFQFLLEVAYDEGQTQITYARSMGEERALVSRTARTFQILNLIQESTAPDGRSKSYILTEKGKKLMEVIHATCSSSIN